MLSLAMLGVGTVLALPFFISHAAVVGMLQRWNADIPLLLDWKGMVVSALGIASNEVSVLVFSPSGELLASATGAASPGKARAIVAVLSGTGARR